MNIQNISNTEITQFEATQDVYNREISYLTQEILKNDKYKKEIKDKIIELREERKNLRKLDLANLIKHQQKTSGISDRFISNLK